MSVSIKQWSVAVAVAAVLAPAAVSAADVQSKQAELQKMCSESLDKLYKAKPELKAAVAKAAGYGCFTSFGMSFFVGGAGGSGLVHSNATKKDTYMRMAQVSGGLDFGVKGYHEVLVFKDAKTLDTFTTSGWELGGGGGATAAADGKGGSKEQTMITSSSIEVYPMTSTGLSIGVAATGRKYWKDDELNAK